LRGQRIVVFRGESGETHAVAARCPHLGSDLGRGRVVGDAIECPYHRFRFRGDGRCLQTRDLKAHAYPAAERFGAVFVFMGTEPFFDFPAFAEGPDLVSARPLHFRLETPWYMVGANAFDARHFGATHSRRLTGKPRVRFEDPLTANVAYEYAIEGKALTDRAIRAVSGSRVAFDVTSWRGNVLLVRARFRRDASFGVVVAAPGVPAAGVTVPGAAATAQTDVTVIVKARRGRMSALIDRLSAEIKRIAIRQLLRDDFESLQGLDYVPTGLQAGDEVLAAYLRWLREAACDSDRG
jgi:nitrite reductase/ring-hydroxylating ferredoxin subunit